jgi:hypothetical protein
MESTMDRKKPYIQVERGGTRVETACAAQGVKMADVIRELLEQQFPKP